MHSVLEVLPYDKFIRVHKSYILAIDQIKSLRGTEILIERKGKRIDIPIGITYKKEVLRRLGVAWDIGLELGDEEGSAGIINMYMYI